MRPAWGRAHLSAARCEELDPHEEVALRRLRDRAVPGRAPRARVRLRVRRGRPARALRRRDGAARLGVTPGPDFGRLQAGETVNGVTPEQVVGEPRRGRRIVLLRRHRARARRPRSSPTTPTCSSTRRRSSRTSASARARPGTRPPARRPRSRPRAGVKLLALTHLSTRYFPRDVRDEARAVFANTRRPARLRHDRGPVPRARGAAPGQGGHPRTDMSTIAFFPEGAYGPTNNCVGIGDVLRAARPPRRVHRRGVVRRHARGAGLRGAADAARARRPRCPRSPGQFWKDFIRETAPVFRKPTIEQLGDVHRPDLRRRCSTARATSTSACARSSTSSQPDVIVEDNVVALPGAAGLRAPVGADRLLQPGRGQRPRRPAAVLRLPGRRPRAVGRLLGRVRAHARRSCTRRSARSAWSAARRRCRELEFMHTSPYAEPLRSIPDEVDYARAAPLGDTWHNLQTCVRAHRRAVGAAGRAGRARRPARLPVASARSARPTSS